MATTPQILSTLARYRSTLASTLERITIPKSVAKRRAAKLRKKGASVIKTQATESPLIISCKRKELNHYRDNQYVEKPGEEIPLRYLASGGWLHYKSKGDYFTINTHGKRHHLDKQVKFQDLGLDSNLDAVLKKERILHPSHIQVESIPAILGNSNVICAAGTGCGKTLAYLLPILQSLSKFRSTMEANSMTSAALTSTCPRAIVIVPSQELSEQVTEVAETLCAALSLTVLNVCQGSTTNRLISSLKAKPRDVDLLVTSPGSLSLALMTKAISPALVNHVIIDEADTLMDSSFGHTTTQLLNQLAAKPSGILGMQIVLASATMPRDLRRILEDTISVTSFTHCVANQLHHMLPHVTQKFIRLGHIDKVDELVKIMKTSKANNTIIFANKCDTATFLNDMLEKNDVPNILLHARLQNMERSGKFERFQNGECDVLVCSDVGSRGLDTSKASQVINYNFPGYISDYIHRVGRVGRLGSLTSGKVINLVGHRPEISLVWQIERAVRANADIAELPNVNANIKKQRKTKAIQNKRQRQQTKR